MNDCIELKEALEQLLDRLNYFGSIDLVREEGPIQDAKTALANHNTQTTG